MAEYVYRYEIMSGICYDAFEYRGSPCLYESWKVVADCLKVGWKRSRDQIGESQRLVQNAELLDAFSHKDTVGLALENVFAIIVNDVCCDILEQFQFGIGHIRDECQVSLRSINQKLMR